MVHRCVLSLVISIFALCGCETTSNRANAGLPPESDPSKMEKDLKTPAGKYDKALFLKIQKKWAELAGEQERPKDGTVRVAFKVLSDGKVQDFKFVEKPADLKPEFVDYCRRAVLESSPFEPFPKELSKQFNTRKFTIYFEYRL